MEELQCIASMEATVHQKTVEIFNILFIIKLNQIFYIGQ